MLSSILIVLQNIGLEIVKDYLIILSTFAWGTNNLDDALFYNRKEDLEILNKYFR